MYLLSKSMWNDDQLDEKTDTTELDDRLESWHMTSHTSCNIGSLCFGEKKCWYGNERYYQE